MPVTVGGSSRKHWHPRLGYVQETLRPSLPTASPNLPVRLVGPNITSNSAVTQGRVGKETAWMLAELTKLGKPSPFPILFLADISSQENRIDKIRFTQQ